MHGSPLSQLSHCPHSFLPISTQTAAAAAAPTLSTAPASPTAELSVLPLLSPAMVLAELGGKITRALQTMASSSIIDDEVVSKLTSSIAMALLQADVDIKLVKQMQNNIKTACALDDSTAGANKRKMIQSVSIHSAQRASRAWSMQRLGLR